jgi:hypothetical protein
MTDDSETIAMRVTVIGGGPIAEIGMSSVADEQQHFCSCVGTTHFDLRLAQRGLSFDCRGWVHFITLDFRTRRAAARQCLRLFVVGAAGRSSGGLFCLAGPLPIRMAAR